jgi:hypothetical protein
MRKAATIILLAATGVSLSACGGGGLFNRARPDEFAVTRAAPLVVPPDFALNPPAPGAPRPQDAEAANQALDALFGGPAPRSEIETNTILKAGRADVAIRSTVGDPKTQTVAKGNVTQDILAAPQGDGREAQAVAG